MYEMHFYFMMGVMGLTCGVLVAMGLIYAFFGNRGD